IDPSGRTVPRAACRRKGNLVGPLTRLRGGYVIRARLLARPPRRSPLVVLVVAAPPGAGLVAPPGCAVEPLVHAPEAVQPARIGGIGVVDDAVFERERAHARPLARVRGHVGPGHRRELGRRPFGRWRAERGPRRP